MNGHRPTGRRPRFAAILRGLFALTVLLFLLGVIPVGLYAVSGPPIPHQVPSWPEIAARLNQPDTDNALFLAMVRLIGWCAWAIFAWATTSEALCFARGHSPRRSPTPIRPFQHLARDLIATAALILTTAGPITTAAEGHHQAVVVSNEPLDAPYVGGSLDRREPAAVSFDQTGPLNPPTAAPVLQMRRPRKQQTIAGFPFGSAQLSTSAKRTLAQMARDIARDGDREPPVVIVGYTDSLGPADYNQHLSLQRARAARQALGDLANHGFDIRISGRGEHDPIAQETRPDGSDDPAGRARNRRVEITYTPRKAPQASSSRRSSPPPSVTTSPQMPPVPPATRGKAHQPSPPASRPRGDTGVPTTQPEPPSTIPPVSPSSPNHHQPGQAVRLPTGALLGLGMASAISIAVAATRLHRRHRRTPQPDRLTVAEPEPQPPAAARALRKAHLEAHTAAGHPVPSDTQLLEDAFVTHEPTHLRIGIRDGSPASVPIAGLNVGLTGPGATDAARAIAAELLTCARHARLELLLTEQAAATLFNLTGDELTQLRELVPDLTLAPGLDAALRHLEIEILHRSRMMADEDIADITALRTAVPGEPLPAIVLIAEIDESERFAATLPATLQVAQRHGIGALLLGPWPTGTTCHIDTDGRVTDADGPEASAWADLQLFHLSPSEGAELLQVIRTARGTDDPPPPEPTTQQEREPPAEGEHPPQAPALLQPPHLKEAAQTRPVHLHVLGPVRVETASGPIGTGLRSISRDLMALLALHPDGITREQGVDALWPERDLAGGSQMFHTAINSIRQALRKATGMREPMFVTHADGRYRLDAHLINVDLWHFLRALDAAAHANSDTDRIPALHRLADLYTGELAEDLSYEWAEGERERIRRTATDALVRLARILQDDHPDDALTALEQAFNHDPVSEPLARDLMHLQAHLGHPDAARRTHQLLRHHLDNLDIDPSQETDRLLTEILRSRWGS